MSNFKKWKPAVAAVLGVVCIGTTAAEPIPATLAGSWRIVRILPTNNTACWSNEQANELVGSTLVYRDTAMRWKEGEVPLQDVVTRSITASQFRRENGGPEDGVSFAQLGIHASRILEVDLQHEDADITGATTEVPGDSILLVAPNRIVVSACGVFYEATRAAGVSRVQAHR